MTQSNPREGILEAARKLQEDKLTAVGRLVDTRARIDTIEAQLADAQREDANAYKLALDAGWSEAELKAVGVDAPARPLPGRPRKAPRQARAAVSAAAGAALAGGGTGSAFHDAQLRREAEASTALDRDQTHVVGDPS